MTTRESVEARLWCVDKSGPPHPTLGTACWVRSARRTNSGHTQLKVHGRETYAHRVAWMLTNGPVPADMLVLHRCDNPPCVNPEHLFLGTHADNMADMRAKGRRAGIPQKDPRTCSACGADGHDRRVCGAREDGR